MRVGDTDNTAVGRRSVLVSSLGVVLAVAGCLGSGEETVLQVELDGELTFRFDVDGDREIEIQIQGSTDSTVQIELEKPNGDLVEEALPVGRATIVDAPVDGEYRLSVEASETVSVEVLVR